MEGFQIWFLPAAIIAFTILVAIPLSAYMAKIMNGAYRPPKLFAWCERILDTGPMNWKQYTIALLSFQTVLFIYSYVVMSLQPIAPWNPRHLGMLSPSTIFNSVVSFMTNTDLQHYSGDQVLSNFTQLFWAVPNLFLSASIGLCALTLIIRLFRGEKQVGNYFVDMWRVCVYLFLPVAFVLGVIFIQQGMPMTWQSTVQVQTLEPGALGTTDSGQAKPQTEVVGPVAAFIPQKMLGTNGGGFYGMNSAHPYENPSAGTNFFETFGMMVFPFSLVLMYGRMLKKVKHATVIFAVMLLLFIGTIAWNIVCDTLRPNPGLTAHPAGPTYTIPSRQAPNGRQPVPVPAVAGLPVDQHLGNLEGKDLRFGTSAGAAFDAITTDVTCGAINAEEDSTNPLTGVSPMAGMWINAIFGGKGVGMINMLIFLVIGVFIAGQMVGRTPEYLGRKIGAKEMKLATIALLVHPLLILFPAGLFAATSWGTQAVSNPGPHGLSQIVYQFSSASANNGSAFDGLGVTYGLNNNPSPAPTAVQFDIAAAFVMLFSRLLPILAPIAMVAALATKKVAPFGIGTLRDDTATFGGLLLGTFLIIGALLFLVAAALGPIADQLGPIPFGG